MIMPQNGLSIEHCDLRMVSWMICVVIFKGVTTNQLDELAEETAIAIIANHSDCASLDGVSAALQPRNSMVIWKSSDRLKGLGPMIIFSSTSLLAHAWHGGLGHWHFCKWYVMVIPIIS